MSSKLLLLFLVLFQELHFNHPNFDTEWWYYTGNLQSSDGHHYGYELTFFRQKNKDAPASKSVWNLDQLYLAHLALSDLDGQKFEHSERLNRSGPGLAGMGLAGDELAGRKYWNGNWNVQWVSEDGEQNLQAISPDFTLNLKLRPEKSFVINGVDGISWKGPAPDEFSRYITFTRLQSRGSLARNGSTVSLQGTSWMDHEFFNDSNDPTLQGWDWFAVQLNNQQELMLYRLRLKSGAPSPYSSATFVDAAGLAHHLNARDFVLIPGGNWKSPVSGATYPLAWQIEIPALSIRLSETTRLKQQELYTKGSVSPGYWEGAVDYLGSEKGSPVRGVGYLEMTGYQGAMRWGH